MGNKGINVRSPIACRELPLKSLSSLMANMTLSVTVLGAIWKIEFLGPALGRHTTTAKTRGFSTSSLSFSG